MDQIYSEGSRRLFEELDVSLDPPGPDSLFEVAAPFLEPGGHILDVGCRDARHLVTLVERHAGTGSGVDPVPWHVERARLAVREAGLEDRITVRRGVAEDLAEASGSVDTVWCRDVVEVLPDLDGALAEMRRVLRPGGHVVIYTNVLNGPLDPVETRDIHEPLGNVAGNLVEEDLEAAFARHDLRIVRRDVVGTRWREFIEEHEQWVSRDLLRLARLRRTRDRVIERHGADAFRTAQASLQWGVNQLLGRFVPMIYVLR
ncbi:class I SAM-dependent methyltransferase [Actinoplanes sp. NBRC 103695]|uniref:class I SAM-dependent methyltransferase n=1 Tax=Actinoplanes sp. NBRC 103695 TaxID=3032202 RepID=UPI0025566CDE|nr:class I SAM-dependent methyltransferase [Actinoplanes sp. NBRC 103695]